MINPELKISYNPFTVETIFLLNGEQGNTPVLVSLAKGKRIQQWIDKLFMPELFKNLNTDELDFIFEGTELGVDDVRDAVNAFNDEYGKKYRINANYIAHPVKADKKIQQLRDLFHEAQTGPFDEFRSTEMHRAFEKALAPEFDVTVLATMSAGKSTVINAMVGKELLPSKNEACTATIARVINEDTMQKFMARRLGIEGEVLDDWQNITEEEQLALVGQWNEDEATSTIELKGNIPAINVRDGIQMVLVDTPGPNNSNDASHRAATVRAINNSQPSMVLYVLNATQLGVDDDNSLLGLIKEAMSKGGREAHDRFIFIANKIDMLDPDKETVISVIKNVKSYLEKNGIINPIVIPISAELAKLIRIKRFYGEDVLSRKQKRTLNSLIDQFVEEEDMNLLERSRNDLSRSVYQKIKKQVDQAKENNDDEKLAELLSGVPIIETLLDTYLMKHAVPSRIKDAVQVFNTIAHEKKIKQNLNDLLSMSESELAEAALILDDFNNSKSRVEQAANFRERVSQIKYVSSDDTKKQKIDIDRKVKELLDSLRDGFSKKLDQKNADTIMHNADVQAKKLLAEIKQTLEISLEEEMKLKVSAIKYEYDRYVSDLIGSFPDSKNMEILKALQTTSLEMPDVGVLVENAKVEEKRKVFVGTERHGFLWLKKRDVYKTVCEEKIDMKKIGEEFRNALQNSQFSLLSEFDAAAEKNFSYAKKSLLAHMKALDDQLADLINKIKYIQSSHEEKRYLFEHNQRLTDWFDGFESKLYDVLNIGDRS